MKRVPENIEEFEKLLAMAQTLTHSLVNALEQWKSAVEKYKKGDISLLAVNTSQKVFSDTTSQLGLITAPSIANKIGSSLAQGSECV